MCICSRLMLYIAKLGGASDMFGDVLCRCLTGHNQFANKIFTRPIATNFEAWLYGHVEGVVQNRRANFQIDELSLLPSSAQTSHEVSVINGHLLKEHQNREIH